MAHHGTSWDGWRRWRAAVLRMVRLWMLRLLRMQHELLILRYAWFAVPLPRSLSRRVRFMAWSSLLVVRQSQGKCAMLACCRPCPMD